MHRGIRIAYLANFSPRKLGTGENRFVALAREVKHRGHSLVMFCHQPIHADVARAFSESGVRVEDLASVAARPFFWTRRLARDFDVIQLNAIAPRSPTALVAYAAWPTKVLFVDHISPPADEAPGGTRSAVTSWLDRVTMIRVWQAAGVSGFIRQRLERRFALAHHRGVTMYGGVDTDRFRPGDGVPVRHPELRITAVAALIPEKGIDVLLRALTRGGLGPWRLRVVGDGPDLARLQRLAAGPGSGGQVEFLGLRDDVDDLLRDTDVFVHPAVWQEALGYTILEGMATGCAVIATRTGGIPELISDQKDGLLVEPGDDAALHAALARLAESPDLRAMLGHAARRRVMAQFTLRENVRRTMDWFEAAARSEHYAT